MTAIILGNRELGARTPGVTQFIIPVIFIRNPQSGNLPGRRQWSSRIALGRFLAGQTRDDPRQYITEGPQARGARGVHLVV